MDGFQVTIVCQVLRVSFIVGASGVWQTINIFLHSIRLVGVSIEGESNESRELDVEGFRVWGVDLIEICGNGVDHLQMHSIVDGDLQQQEMS